MKIVTSENKRPPFKKIVIIAILTVIAILIPTVYFLTKDEETKTVDQIETEGTNEDQEKVENKKKVVEDITPTPIVTENPTIIENPTIAEDPTVTEDPTTGDIYENFVIEEVDPYNGMTPEEYAKTKSGWYYDGAWIDEQELIGSIIGPGYSKLPEWVPRFYDPYSYKFVKEPPAPVIIENPKSNLTQDILDSIDPTDSLNMSKMERYKRDLGKPITEALDTLNYAAENIMFDGLEDYIGIKVNHEYYEQTIIKDLAYIRNKIYAEIRNEDNPYKEVIRALMLKVEIGGDDVPFYDGLGYTDDQWHSAIGYWLENGGEGEIDPSNHEKGEDSKYTRLIRNNIYNINFQDLKGFGLYGIIGEKDGEEFVFPTLDFVLNGKIYMATFDIDDNGELFLYNII